MFAIPSGTAMTNDAPKPHGDDSAARSASREPGVKRPASSVLEQLRAKTAGSKRYERQREIARGGMGAIVRVWDSDLRRTLAMKVMLGFDDSPPKGSSDGSRERRVARFLDEAQITGQLDHPGIIPVHELGIDEQGQLFFTMRLVKGRELREIFELVEKNAEGWTQTRALGVLLRVCEAMAFAHEKGVIHRDLKPANIMVGRFGEVYVMDWGLAKVLGSSDAHDVRIAPRPDLSKSIVRSARDDLQQTPESPLSTMDGDIVGTPCYMPPEQARGRLEDIGPHSDVYSVGSMLYELLSGEQPYCARGDKPSPQAVLGALMQGPPRAVASIKPGLPEDLVAICEKAMAHDLRDRYPSMLGVAEDLRAFLEGRVVKAHETGPVAEFKKWIARNKSFAYASAAALAAVFLGIGGMLWLQYNAKERLSLANTAIERNLKLATEAQHAADDARKQTETVNTQLEAKSAEALRNAELAQRKGYAANIAAADANLRFQNVAGAKGRLADCDEKLRGWEWQHLTSRCDASVRQLAQTEGEVVALEVSPDEKTVACATVRAGFADPRLIEVASGATLRAFEGHTKAVLALAFDPAGKRLATVALDRTLRVFDVDTGALVTSAQLRASSAPTVTFTPDGASVLVSLTDKSMQLVDAASGAVVRDFAARPSSAVAVRISPDGTRIAVASRDSDLALLDASTGALLRELGNRESPIASIAFSPDGMRVLAAGGRSSSLGPDSSFDAGYALRMWSAKTGALLGVWSGHEARVTWCAFGPSGRTIFSASEDRSLRAWNIDTAEVRVLLGHASGITAAAIAPRSQTIFSGSSDDTLRMWDANVIDGLAWRAHRATVQGVRFTADGTQLVTGGSDETARVWDASSGLPLRTWSNPPRPGAGVASLRSMTTSPTGHRIAVGDNAGHVNVFDADDEAPPVALAADESEAAICLAFSPDGKSIAVGSPLGNVRIFDIAARSVQKTLRSAAESITAVAWSSDGATLFAGTTSKKLLQWDVASATSTTLADDFRGSLETLAFDASGARLLASAQLGDLRIFDVAKPGSVRYVASDISGSRGCFIGDGSRFAAIAGPGHVSVCDSESGSALLDLRGSASETAAIAASPDGRELAAGFSDGTVRRACARALRSPPRSAAQPRARASRRRFVLPSPGRARRGARAAARRRDDQRVAAAIRDAPGAARERKACAVARRIVGRASAARTRSRRAHARALASARAATARARRYSRVVPRGRGALPARRDRRSLCAHRRGDGKAHQPPDRARDRRLPRPGRARARPRHRSADRARGIPLADPGADQRDQRRRPRADARGRRRARTREHEGRAHRRLRACEAMLHKCSQDRSRPRP
jgi:WD40 repeat protein/serine/threonine protein kinase